MEVRHAVAREFGLNLLALRKRAKLSQEELGFLASLHRTEISQLEKGARLARIDTLVKLAGALSVPRGDLLKGMTWKALGPVGSLPLHQQAGVRTEPCQSPCRPTCTEAPRRAAVNPPWGSGAKRP